MAGGRHGGGVDAQNDGFAVARTDLDRSLLIGGKVDVVAARTVQPLPAYGRKGFFRRAVKKHGGRFGGLVLDLHLLRGMSLRGTDAAAVFGNGEPFFVVGFHDFHQHFARDAKAGTVVEIGFCQQLVYIRPTVFVECQTDLLGTVAQNQAEEFADRFALLFV